MHHFHRINGTIGKQTRWQFIFVVSLLAATISDSLYAGDLDELANMQQHIRAMRAKGNYREAIPLAQDALQKVETSFANKPTVIAVALIELANLYMDQGKYAEAEPLFQRAVTIYEKSLGTDHPLFANSLNHLAILYWHQSKHREAEPLLNQALKIREKALGPDHLEVAESLQNLATLYMDQGKYAEAEPLYQRALKIDEKVNGSDHPDVALTLNNLANLYKVQGKYAQAEPLYQRSLKIREKALGSEAPRVATSLNSLAVLYVAQGKFAEAEPLYQRALKIYEKVYGSDHPDVALCVNNLAALYRIQDRFAEAEPLQRRALRIFEKILGPEHPHVATSLDNLGSMSANRGKYAEAEPLFQRALQIREKSRGPNHPDVADSLDSLALLYVDQRRYAEAEPLFRRALQIRERSFGPDHPNVSSSLDYLASLYNRQSKYAEAEPLYLRALQIREKSLGPNHPNVAGSCHNLANFYYDQSKYSAAEPLYQRSLKIYEKSYGLEHPAVADSLRSLADLYKKQGKYAEAEPLIDRAIAIDDRAGAGPTSRYLSYRSRSIIVGAMGKRAAALADLHRALDLAEEQRILFSGAEQDRAKGFESFLSAFEQMVAWQQQLGPDGDLNEVVSAIERSRARSLLDDLNLAGVDFDQGRTPEERERLRKHEVDVKSRAAQLEKKFESMKSPEERAKLLPELGKAREAIYVEYRDRRASSPVYRQLLSAGGQPIRLEQLQKALTPDKSLLLNYFLGEQTAYLLTIQSDQARLLELSVNDEKARILGCDAGPLTSKRMQTILMNHQKTGVLQKLSNHTTAMQATAQLAALWLVLVPEAQRVQLQSGDLKQLLIVPDGPLSSLPFEVLVVSQDDPPTYLLDVAPPIQYGPSATVLYNLKQRVVANDKPQSQPVLTVANAQYGIPPAATGDSLAMLSTGTRYARSGGHLQPLPYTGTEAAWLYDSFTKLGIKVGRLLQSDATEANVRFNIPGRRIVHLACHGLVDREYGNFFGSLAVTPGPRAATDPSDDGFLTLAEINQLDLKSCELAILSACETNFGPQQKGEGTWALSRGFIVAGAKRVVASNWLVDDEAAANLVSYFCGGLARDEQKSQVPHYAARLQSAKRWIRQQDKWSSPYYWAPFVLVGPD